MKFLAPLMLVALLFACGCASQRPGERLVRYGDEIVIAGQLFHTGTLVVLWTDPGGFDGYRVERRFSPLDQSDWPTTTAAWTKNGLKDTNTPNRYGIRQKGLTPDELELVRGGGWPLEMLRERIDQFVLHFDVCGTSRQCFNILHDHRGLSVHFMIDLDGTIYQTLDVKERARHATIANDRSVGVEIANIGAYPASRVGPLERWYQKDESGQDRVVLPQNLLVDGKPPFRLHGFVARPARPGPIVGEVQGDTLAMQDFTPEQYEALARLSATLCVALPNIAPDYPRDASGKLIPRQLSPEQFEGFHGILGHYHVQGNKNDPGPAMNWDWLVERVRKLMPP